MKIINTLTWIFEFYFLWILYNDRKYYRYKNYMTQKWGQKFTNKI
jgi:hypothetical protein